MKKYLFWGILAIIALIISLCSFNNNVRRVSIDDLYNKIKNSEFDNIELIDLNYEQINKTNIYVGDQAFGFRDMLLDDNSESTQRILCYMANDGTQITIVLGKIITNKFIENNMVSVYSDNLRYIGLSDSDISSMDLNSHVDSSIYLFDNIIVNVVSVNINNPLNDELVTKFNEKLVEDIKNMKSE